MNNISTIDILVSLQIKLGYKLKIGEPMKLVPIIKKDN